MPPSVSTPRGRLPSESSDDSSLHDLEGENPENRLRRSSRQTISAIIGLGAGRKKRSCTGFTLEEDMKIIKYIAINGPKISHGRKLRGMSIIVEFCKDFKEVADRHTALSIHNRMKSIRKNIDAYRIPSEWKYAVTQNEAYTVLAERKQRETAANRATSSKEYMIEVPAAETRSTDNPRGSKIRQMPARSHDVHDAASDSRRISTKEPMRSESGQLPPPLNSKPGTVGYNAPKGHQPHASKGTRDMGAPRKAVVNLFQSLAGKKGRAETSAIKFGGVGRKRLLSSGSESDSSDEIVPLKPKKRIPVEELHAEKGSIETTKEVPRLSPANSGDERRNARSQSSVLSDVRHKNPQAIADVTSRSAALSQSRHVEDSHERSLLNRNVIFSQQSDSLSFHSSDRSRISNSLETDKSSKYFSQQVPLQGSHHAANYEVTGHLFSGSKQPSYKRTLIPGVRRHVLVDGSTGTAVQEKKRSYPLRKGVRKRRRMDQLEDLACSSSDRCLETTMESLTLLDTYSSGVTSSRKNQLPELNISKPAMTTHARTSSPEIEFQPQRLAMVERNLAVFQAPGSIDLERLTSRRQLTMVHTSPDSADKPENATMVRNSPSPDPDLCLNLHMDETDSSEEYLEVSRTIISKGVDVETVFLSAQEESIRESRPILVASKFIPTAALTTPDLAEEIPSSSRQEPGSSDVADASERRDLFTELSVELQDNYLTGQMKSDAEMIEVLAEKNNVLPQEMLWAMFVHNGSPMKTIEWLVESVSKDDAIPLFDIVIDRALIADDYETILNSKAAQKLHSQDDLRNRADFLRAERDKMEAVLEEGGKTFNDFLEDIHSYAFQPDPFD